LNELLENISRLKTDCIEAIKIFGDNTTITLLDSLEKSIIEIAKSWSGSWLGYHSTVYYNNFVRPDPGDNFSVEWGLQPKISNPTSDKWIQYDYDEVITVILRRAGYTKNQIDDLEKSLLITRKCFEESRNELITLIEIIYNKNKDKLLEKLLNEASNLKSFSQQEIIAKIRPTDFLSRDSLAYSQGLKTPPHIAFQARIISLKSVKVALENLIECFKKSKIILEKNKDDTNMLNDGYIFIGHGHSSVWKDLKEFLTNRLNLPWEEFNRVSAAGHSHKERLQKMLNNSKFAFIIMTAEDEHRDNKLHARESVIHEVGLFQGKLGFEKAIILLEEGCSEFSNIEGLGQIRFSKDNIKADFEEIRKVLERENIISKIEEKNK